MASITLTVVQNTSLITAVVGSWAWIVRLVLTGKLVTRAQIEDLVKDRDLWKEAHWRVQAVSDGQTEQIRALLKITGTTTDVLKAIPPATPAGEAEHEPTV